MIIWRPVLAGKVTLTEVKNGTCDLIDLLKLNSLLDHDLAQQHAAHEEARRK